MHALLTHRMDEHGRKCIKGAPATRVVTT